MLFIVTVSSGTRDPQFPPVKYVFEAPSSSAVPVIVRKALGRGRDVLASRAVTLRGGWTLLDFIGALVDDFDGMKERE
jgi:hypothetical protein